MGVPNSSYSRPNSWFEKMPETKMSEIAKLETCERDRKLHDKVSKQSIEN